MSYRSITVLVLLGVVVALLVWEGIVISKNDPQASTISEVCMMIAFRYPIFVLLLGILIGHICFPINPPVHTPTFTNTPPSDTKGP